MAARPLRDFLARHAETLFAAALGVLVTAMTVRHVHRLGKHTPGALETLDRPLEVTDFEAFYRCALRMAQGLPMYHVDSLDRAAVVEQPSKQAPFFELLLQPFCGHGIAFAIAAFGALSLLALLHSLRLARQLLADGGEGAPPWRFAPHAALLLLLPTLHLNLLYWQTGIVLVWLLLLGASWLGTRPLLAGAAWSVAIAMKVVPVVFLVFLLWRRQWRAAAGCVLGLLAANGAVLAYTGYERGVEQYRAYAQMLRSDPAFAEYHERYQGLPSLVRATVTANYETGLVSRAQQRDWNGTRNFLPSLAPWANALSAGVVGLVLLVCAWACWPRRAATPQRLLQEASLVAIALLLVSPHTWRHYYWWLFPTALLAVHGARRRERWALTIVAALVLGELLPHRGLLGSAATWFQVFHGHAITATIAFAALATHLVQERRPGQRAS